MAGYNSIGAYEATSVIPEFKGLMQYGDGIGTDPRFAVEAKNIETFGGVLQPAAKCEIMVPTLTNPIETLARLYRRWHSGDDKEILIAASGGKLYSMLPSDDAWTQLDFPTGITEYQSNVWSWVTYEINPIGATDPVDVLLLSNALDGMIMVRGDDLTVTTVETPKKFGVIERYAERIWGGAIPDDPDMLVYSAPYDPTDWEADPDIPEDGAGDIQQPSWDGDSFTALRTFGSQLIAFKRTRVWRILGTDPGEYAFKEQYGGGATYEGTIAVDNERILMLGQHGVQIYDGLSVSPFQQEMCDEIWKRMNVSCLDKAAAILWHNCYYCAVPIDLSEINNAVVIYNTADGTWLLRDDVYVESWLGTEESLYFTSSTTPGRLWLWEENSWDVGIASTAYAKWVTPWNDLGTKRIVKGGFEVYLLCEVQDDPVTLSISLQTEKKTKTKTYTVQPITAEDKNHKQKRIHFGGSGRRFRLIIETNKTAPYSEAPWRLVSGLLIVSETDPD